MTTQHAHSIIFLCALAVCAACTAAAQPASAVGTNATPAALTPATWTDELHFDCRATWRIYPEYTGLNPDAAALLPGVLLPPSRAEVSNMRLDLRASPYEVVDLELKPRFDYSYQEWRQGARSGDENWKESAYLNGWLAQVHLGDQLALAYAREDLEWGPSYLASPSNPFRNNNGRNLPQLELPGMDYVKAIWTPDTHWSFSALANVDDGRAELPPLVEAGVSQDVIEQLEFQRTYALKADYTAEGCNFSLIGSENENHDKRLGGYASCNVSDAVVVYSEAGAGKGGDLDYLLGTSYTFANNSTVNAEYFHNGINSDEQTAGFSRLIAPTGPYAGFINHDYALLQFRKADILNHVDVILRWIHCIDDSSDRLAGELECSLNDHASLFVDGMTDLGSTRDEYGMLLQYIVMAGVKLSL